MARKKEHSRKFHYEVLHYLKHKSLYKTTKLCWDEKKKEYVTTFFFHFGETFKKMGVEVII